MSKDAANSHSKMKGSKSQPKISNFFRKRLPDDSGDSSFTGISKKTPAIKENDVSRKTVAKTILGRSRKPRPPSTSSDDCIECIPPTPGDRRPAVLSVDSPGSPGDIIPPTPQVPWAVRRSNRGICQELSPNERPVINLDSSDSSIILDSPQPPAKVSLTRSRRFQAASETTTDRKRDLSLELRVESISKKICAKTNGMLEFSNRSRKKLELTHYITSSDISGLSSSLDSPITPDKTRNDSIKAELLQREADLKLDRPNKEVAKNLSSADYVSNKSGERLSQIKTLLPVSSSISNASNNSSDSSRGLAKGELVDPADGQSLETSSKNVTTFRDGVAESSCSSSERDKDCENKIGETPVSPEVRLQEAKEEPKIYFSEKTPPTDEPSSVISQPVKLEVCSVTQAKENCANEKDLNDLTWSEDFQFPSSQELQNAAAEMVKSTISMNHIAGDSVFVNDCQRHLVTSVSCNPVTGQPELMLVSERDRVEQRCLLRGFWADTKVKAGDVVNLLSADLAAAGAGGTVVVDDHNGSLLVVQPDFLVSGTTVVATLFCPRKAVLNEWFRGVEPGNTVMFIGSLVHQLFQTSVSSHAAGNVAATSPASLSALLERLLRQGQFLTDRYVHRATLDDSRLRDQLRPLVKQVSVWAGRHLAAGQRDGGGKRRGDHVQVVAVHDIEENIWSPRFGVKGKVDMTTEIRVGDERETRVLPLELKTGRSSFSPEHEGQVQLYSMVSGDRRVDPREGLLLYISDGRMKRVPTNYRAGLVQLRNSVAHGLSQPLVDLPSSSVADGDVSSVVRQLHPLPNAAVSASVCQRCPFLTTCSIYHRLVDPVGERPGFDELAEQSVAHLGEEHVGYFLRWVALLFLEKHHARSEVGHLWLSTARRREEQGECLSDMLLVPLDSPDVEEAGSEASAFMHRFSRSSNHWNSNMSLLASGISAGQYVIVSVEEPRKLALTMGTVQSIAAGHLQVLLDKNLYSRPDLTDAKYRIDSYSSQLTDGVCFTNVALLMSDEEHCSRLRKFVVNQQSSAFRNKLSKDVILKCRDLVRELNSQQQRAIFSALMTDDYLLIRGFPGSGKSSTLVVLVQVLVALGHSVLLASHTHAAVDNLLLKLAQRGVPFVRLGKAARAHPSLHDSTEEVLMRGARSVDDVTKIFGAQVMASTCLGVRHNVLRSRDKFDYCIVDEATQIVEPAVLGPLFHSRRFVLVGDPHQLPPVVRNAEARRGGMDRSLFVRLDSPEATRELSIQYRMNGEIVHLANLLSYELALKCANEEVAEATLRLSRTVDSVVPDQTDGARWLRRVLSDELSATVIFLDTDRLPPDATVVGSGKLVNDAECRIVMTIVNLLLKAGLPAEQLGVISPFRDQVAHIKRSLELSDSGCATVEVNTVDQYQGRDKDVIIISCVKNSESGEGGGILSDKRRINVAITRARHKLIFVGSRVALAKHEPLALVLDSLRDDQVIVLQPNDSFPK